MDTVAGHGRQPAGKGRRVGGARREDEAECTEGKGRRVCEKGESESSLCRVDVSDLEPLTVGLQSRALDEAREDRERVALRVEREKIAREAAAQRQAEEEERAKEEERLRSLEGKNEEGETLHDESKQG